MLKLGEMLSNVMFL